MKRFRTISAIDRAFNLGKIFGIQFRIHYTWFIVFVLVVYSLSAQYFPDSYPSWRGVTYWIIGTISALLLFASVVAHELAHSLVARANGIPVKNITLFIFGGVAQITKDATKARAELVVAAAGPGCSLAISGASGLLWFLTQGTIGPMAAIFLWLAQVNVTLAAFNLIPGFPLDGGRIFHSLLWRITGKYHHSTRIATLVGRGVGYFFIAGGILIMFLFHDWFSGLWLALIGWFLANAAAASYRHAKWRERLAALTAAQVMTTNYQVVPASVTLEQLIQEQIFINERLVFLVADDGRVKGIVSLSDIKTIPPRRWGTTLVEDITVPARYIAYPDQDALSIMEQMDENDLNQVPVVSDGRVVGIIARDSLLSWLRSVRETRD